jgi:nitrate/nitrite transport system substrate-binding protein
MVKEGVDYTGLASRVHRPDLFREVAEEMGLETPNEDMQKETLFDGIEFDPTRPEEYVRSFPVHNIA